jgi:hypothetical protein
MLSMTMVLKPSLNKYTANNYLQFNFYSYLVNVKLNCQSSLIFNKDLETNINPFGVNKPYVEKV